MVLVRPAPALRQRGRDWHLRRRQRRDVLAPGRTLVQANNPGKVRTEWTLQIEQNPGIQVEQNLKSFEAWYSFPFLNFRHVSRTRTSDHLCRPPPPPRKPPPREPPPKLDRP